MTALIFLCLAGLIIFLPAIVANCWKHSQRVPITVFNFLLVIAPMFSHSGEFTTMLIFGWFALLIWTCRERRARPIKPIKSIPNRAASAVKVTSDDFELVHK
jgi:hypothetical protein